MFTYLSGQERVTSVKTVFASVNVADLIHCSDGVFLTGNSHHLSVYEWIDE